jgi:gamma-glutamylcyclotransferase (GGCT)/AIG2-like uncharacterized protein YtfP
MCHKKMKELCPDSRFITKACLIGHKFVYDGGSPIKGNAVANIVESTYGVVWGGLFEISEGDLKIMDTKLKYPGAYKRKEAGVLCDNGITYNAITYYRKGRKINNPGESYRNIVLQGAKDCGIPEDYITNNLLLRINIEQKPE